MQQTATSTDIPRGGMLARIRNRRGIIANGAPRDDKEAGRLELVQVDWQFVEHAEAPAETQLHARKLAVKHGHRCLLAQRTGGQTDDQKARVAEESTPLRWLGRSLHEFHLGA